jgi:exosortase
VTKRLAAPALTLFALAVLYWEVVAGMVHVWRTSDDYSHGFLIAPICAYFVYERRCRLATTPASPSLSGIAVVACGLLLLLAGRLGAELFLTRISLIVVLAGAVLFVLGRAHLRLLAFPLAFSLLMIPLPSVVFNEITFPLQLLASRVAELTLTMLRIPVLREGNVIVLATTTLEVAEACSGIRSLMSLLALGIVYGYFTENRRSRRILLAAATVPIAVVANACRVAGTGVVAHVFGAAAADGLFHAFAGWLVFLSAVIMLFLFQQVVAIRTTPGRLARVPAEITS